MTAFAAVAAAMVAAACAWVLIPLLREQRPGKVERRVSNLAILRDSLQELESERARGTLSNTQYEQARNELERCVLEEPREPTAGVEPARRAGGWTAAVLGALLPIGASALYLTLGHPEALSSTASTDAAVGTEHALTRRDIDAMITKLAERLEKEPGNADGWVMLGRSYFAMNQFPQAARAYGRAVALVPDDAGLLVDYADALAVVQGRSLEGKPLEIVERALAIDSKHWKALALAGTAAFDRQDYRLAIAYWERWKAVVPPGSERARSIEGSITEARTRGGFDASAKIAAGPATTTLGTASPPAGAARAEGKVAGIVKLGPELAAKVAADDTVFIFARVTAGSRMPLAIVRKQAKDLPAAFALDDTMAMMSATRLSEHSDVVVGARVSKSGGATPQSGDLEGLSQPVKVGATDITVVIDTVRR